ncbi:glutamate receptor-like [Macrobrachium rosenbergii]|uniref:glutamate receptor-like n=1 Tax=Macrobrachium rosenbergii TaxID=79674 RepID=UPI0034D42D9F
MKSLTFTTTSAVLQLCIVFLHGIISTEGRKGIGPILKKCAAQDHSESMNELQEVIVNVIEVHFPSCRLLMLKETDDVNINFFLKTLYLRNWPFVLVDRQLMTQMVQDAQLTNELTERILIGRRKTIGCRFVVVYLTNSSYSISVSFLQKLSITKYPHMKVLAIGLPGGEGDFLMSHAFRNTVHALYFAVVSSGWERKPMESTTGKYLPASTQHAGSIRAYLRCLFCDAGRSKVVLTDTWYPKSGWSRQRNFFPDQFKDFNGYTLRMVSKPLPPIVDFIRDTDKPGTSVQFVDCLEIRMLREMAEKMNLTFRAFMPIDDQWGQLLDNGTWTGLINALVKEEADFGTCVFPSSTRNSVVDFTRMYAPEPFLIVTLKPQRLPQYLAIIRPFTMTMWIAVVMSCLAVGLSFWFLHRGLWELSKLTILRQSQLTDPPPDTSTMTYALVYTWSLLLQQTPTENPSDFYGRTWLSCWMIFSFLISTVYRASLFACLLVPQMSEPIDSIPQLLQHGWTWGMEPHYSVGWQFLTESTIPDIQKIAKVLQIRPIAEEMKLVSKGKHALFTWKNYVKNFIAAEYTDRYGNNPIHISREHYLETNGAYWGSRKGAPFVRAITKIQQRLYEASILDVWLNQILQESTKRARTKNSTVSYSQDDDMLVVLNLSHFQGAFYVFFIGLFLATLALVAEYLQQCLSGD